MTNNELYKRTGKSHLGASLALYGLGMAVEDLWQVLIAFGTLFLVSSFCLYFLSENPGSKWKKILDKLMTLALGNTSLFLGFSALALGVREYSPMGALGLYIFTLFILYWDMIHTPSERGKASIEVEE